MERNRPSHKHGRNEREQHRHKRKDLEEHLGWTHRHRSKIGARDRDILGAEAHSGPRIVPGKFSGEDPATPLNAEDDYVRRWLAQAANDDIQDPVHGREPDRLKPDQVPQILSNFLPNHDRGSLEDPILPTKRKRRHDSTDSSLIEISILPKKQSDRNDRRVEKRHHDSRHLHKKWRDEPSVQKSDSEPSDISEDSSKHIRGTFEKRARHRTREDRYEPKKNKKDKKDEEKRRRTRRERKGDRKRASKKADEDLINNFASKSIAQDRLTIRPSSGLGIFKNGRASSPAKRRGLPDLAFSEMEFLRRPNLHQPVEKGERIRSKSREKGKQKTSRAYEEVSDFFKPKYAPLQERDANRGSRLPIQDDYPVYKSQAQSECAQNSSIHARSSRNHRDLSIDFGGTSSGRLSASCGYSPLVNHVRTGPRSLSRASKYSTSYVSWSESQKSKHMTPRRVRNYEVETASPIPEGIRRSLEDTGIFRDTSLGVISEDPRPASSLKSDNPSMLRYAHQPMTERGDASLMTESTVATGSNMNAEFLRPPELPGIVQNAGTRPRKHNQTIINAKKSTNPQNSQQFAYRDNRMEAKQNIMAIDNFDPHLGWNQRPASAGVFGNILPASPKIELTQGVRNVPMSREQLAKYARIKRPSTTVPVVELRKDNIFPHEEIRSSIESKRKKSSPPQELRQDEGTNQKPLNTSLPMKEAPTESATSGLVEKKSRTSEKLHQSPSNVSGSNINRHSNSSTKSSQRNIHVPNVIASRETAPKPRVASSASRDENLSLLGLPLRGSWTNQPNNLQATQPRPVALVTNAEPVFVNRLQQQPVHDFFQHHRNILNSIRDEGAQLQLDTESDSTKQDHYDVAEHPDTVGQQPDPPNDSLSQVDDQENYNYDTGYAMDRRTWEPPLDHPHEEMEDYGSSEYAGHIAAQQQELINETEEGVCNLDQYGQPNYLHEYLIDAIGGSESFAALDGDEHMPEERIRNSYPNGSYSQLEPSLGRQQANNYELNDEDGIWQIRRRF